MKKVPLRTCVVSREKVEKHNLLRVVRTPEKTIVYDKSGKLNGRGVYLKKDKAVILKAQKHKILDKILEAEVPSEVYTLLLNEVKDDDYE